MIRNRLVAACFACSLVAAGNLALADDAAVVRQSVDAFVDAFNRGDAKAVAALWTETGVLVDATGRTYKSRPAIEAAYAELFKSHPGVKIIVHTTGVRKLFGDSLLEEGTATLEPAPTDASEGTKYSAVHVNQGGHWLMSNVRERPAATPTESKLLRDLDWLVGTWTAEEHGAKTKVECRWLPNQSYLERRYETTAADGTATGGVQLIGVNPRTGQVVSWGFNFDGGHTIGAWIPRGNGWGIDAAGVTPDGTLTHAMNILTRLDDNAYSWQSVDRKAGDEPRPNMDEVVLKRSDAKATSNKN